MPDLPFQVGDSAESRSFQVGFRGAWFRCKIREIRTKNGVMAHLLEHFDYPDQKLSWIKLYQKPPTYISKSKGFNRELMVRPSFPTIHHESEKLDVNSISEVVVIVDNGWKVGDLVDWWTDGCYWSGWVTKILGNGKVQIDLLPPPLGEGSSYEALSKDLRPSLDWCPEKGWTVPLPTEDGCRRPCVRIMKPANSGVIVNTHATDVAVQVDHPTVRTYSFHSSQNFEGLLDSQDGSMARRKQCNIARNGREIGGTDNKVERTCFSDSGIMGASIENLERATINSGYNDENPTKKMRSNGSLCLNSMSSNTIDAAILDLEELVNRIKWLRDVLNLGVPLSGTAQPSWEFSHHAPCK
ncbi:uncharacterized protein LOC133306533 isoform X2 [Gastrolobium bilobum]|uniref:uncharacterized protein LOC133306533 isoform X2 n=1 Tax=Gastrolobium bilobum TaxID=150636 RepID=UPI002AB180B6|nr:uncharacterized protein LOC133306533 isoform X2 [Gastrolobium bilobum]